MRHKTSFTTTESAKIAHNLQKKLGPELISYRTGYGQMKLSYIEGWMAISLANKIFGFNGWSSKIKSMIIEYNDKTERGYSIGITAIVTITLKDGTKKEDVGFGSAENQKMQGLAMEKARKEAATDALKRALRQFGNALGNCLYDKEFLKDVQKVQKKGKKFEPCELYRLDDVVGIERQKKDKDLWDLTISDDGN